MGRGWGKILLILFPVQNNIQEIDDTEKAVPPVLFPIFITLSLLALWGETFPNRAAGAAGAEPPRRQPNERPTRDELGLHFGLGTADFEAVTVRWPDGLLETFSLVPKDAIWPLAYPQAALTLTEGFTITTTGGQTITLTHRLTNTGTRADNFQLSAQSTVGTPTLPQAEMALEPGESALIRIQISVPESPGTAGEVTLTAASANDPSAAIAVSHRIYVVRALLHLAITYK
jgi:hypothetical protein